MTLFKTTAPFFLRIGLLVFTPLLLLSAVRRIKEAGYQSVFDRRNLYHIVSWRTVYHALPQLEVDTRLALLEVTRRFAKFASWLQSDDRRANYLLYSAFRRTRTKRSFNKRSLIYAIFLTLSPISVCTSRRLRDVLCTSFDDQKDDSYVGWGTAEAAVQPCSRWAEL